MTRLAWLGTACCLSFGLGCSSSGDDGDSNPVLAAQTAPPTYWHDMAPLFAEHCMQCHREAGIAPFRLDDYAQAKSFAKLIAQATSERTMPPWSATSDGSCSEFADSLALSDQEIARIAAWVNGGATEGISGPVENAAPHSPPPRAAEPRARLPWCLASPLRH